MKKIRYNKIFGWLAAAVLLLTTSCKDDMLFDNNNASDEVTVTFTLTPEAAAPLATRAHKGNEIDTAHVTYPDEGEFHHISDGSRADMLIYSIYEKVDDGKGGHKYEILEGYSDGSDFDGIDAGDGQTIKQIKEFPVTIKLTLKRGAEYSIAFWAQNSECKAYNTKDLRKVEVIYSELDESNDAESNDGNSSDAETTTPNNDERRDAFCRSLTFTAGEGGLEQNVLLYRPLAQINVGTSGYDFETITRNAGKKYLFSKIRLNRVARYLDVVEDKTYSSTTDEEDAFSQDDTKKTPEAFAVVDFGYAPIPAYVNWSEKENENGRLYPEYPSYTIWDWVYNEDYNYPHTTEGFGRENYEGEEFLRVHLFEGKDGLYTENNGIDKDRDGNKYTSIRLADGYRQYANLNNYNDYRSETFKYLSMCYVLTSSTKDEAITINNVKVWMATDAQGSDEIEIVNLNNVPAQRNWRTNIVGNILTEENDFAVKLDRDFAGEYDGLYGNNTAEWSGPLAKGVYYDAEADEIQISDADGLLWFQKMVNGKMVVREAITKSYIGKPYTYYTSTNYTTDGINFNYNGIEDPVKALGSNATDAEKAEAEKLKARILMATHQNEATNNKNQWPTNGNFHFYGKKTENGKAVDYPATVKLMADIDLTGIEWVPIGFDGRILETVAMSFDENIAENRGFYGIFDGNNHTISNLTTRRFGATVPQWSRERTSQDIAPYDKNHKYVDNLQWFGRGLFGEIGGDAKIRNVRLFNPDIYGCHGVGGIVGIAYGNAIEITGCIVDGGSLIVTPMYRGDSTGEITYNSSNQSTSTNYDKTKNRTFARGVYLGGIVGYFNTVGGKVDNCEVRNVYMRGYRRIGGLIGSVDLQKTSKGNGTGEYNLDDTSGTENSNSKPASISNNRISNVVLIASQFSTFGLRNRYDYVDNTFKTGFGWDNSSFDLYAQKFVGGDIKDYVDKQPNKASGNVATNMTFAEFTETLDGKGIRSSSMQSAPLAYMPMLSSWFTDNIMLYNNYYGKPSAKTIMNTHSFQMFSGVIEAYNYTIKDGTTTHFQDFGSQTDKYNFPMALPTSVEVTWAKDGKNVGLYVESVTLDGINSIGGRSVITPTDVQNDGECALFVTARDRKQFYDKITQNTEKSKVSYTAPTTIKNIVVRGDPYAYTGILLSPNENMSSITLDNVAVYDVYQTLALSDQFATGNHWPNKQPSANGITLTANKCNFRGYTVPGAGWKKIIYTHTTFEEGTYTGHGRDERTYKAEAETEFTDCFFKAPYRIDLSAGKKVTFTNSKASSASPTNKEIKLEGEKENAKLITITSDAMGNPVINYYADVDKDGKGVGTPFLTE